MGASLFLKYTLFFDNQEFKRCVILLEPCLLFTDPPRNKFGIPGQKCGGTDRLLVYNFTCAPPGVHGPPKKHADDEVIES